MNRKLRLKASVIDYLEGALFIAPWFIGFLVFMAFPLGYSLFMSFQKVTITATSSSTQFVGLTHYRYILFENGKHSL
ncbi:hypothetical protein LJK87_20610 [Paenibacillus sp. P25]|nr:hypothetical protein LJK87_20610 [Paenibacillus sp. P25]